MPQADPSGVASDCRAGDRFGRSDRLGGRTALRRPRPGRRRHRQRHAPVLLRRGRLHRLERAAADQRARRRVHPLRRRHPGPGRAGARSSSGTARDIARGHPHRRAAAATTGPSATRSPTSTSTRSARSTCCRTPASTAIEAPFIHCSTNKVYGDRPNSLPLIEQETRCEIDAGHPYDERHHRGHVDRRLPALGLRRLQGRRRRDGAGVRPLLRHEDGAASAAAR